MRCLSFALQAPLDPAFGDGQGLTGLVAWWEEPSPAADDFLVCRNRPVEYTRLNARGRRTTCFAPEHSRPIADGIQSRSAPWRTSTRKALCT